jgi:small nuclear ribonucleoprotein (snRNP)-like protein
MKMCWEYTGALVMNSNETTKATLEPSKKPLNVLVKQLNGYIAITLKNGIEYRGNMIKCDGHMNIILEGATECMKDQLLAKYGNVLVRGNNILYIAIDQPKK